MLREVAVGTWWEVVSLGVGGQISLYLFFKTTNPLNFYPMGISHYTLSCDLTFPHDVREQLGNGNPVQWKQKLRIYLLMGMHLVTCLP